jgi:hypothetical protein
VKRIVVAAVACGFLVAAATPALSATSAGNKRIAEHDATRLLQRVVLPAGAVQVAREPRGDGGLLKHVDSIPSGLLVDRHRFWLVPEPLGAVTWFVDHHPPSGGKSSGTGTSGGPGVPPNASTTFSFPALAGRISTRDLEVDLVALPHHRTGVRVDAQEIWIVPRPRSEKVPSAVRVVDVRTSKAHVRVTATAKVREIVRSFDALPIVQPGVSYHCPPETARRPMSLRFLSAGGALLARARVPGPFAAGFCAPIEFWIGSHRQRPLAGHIYGRIEHLLGVRFS